MRSILLFTSQIKISCTSLQLVLIWEIFGGGKRDRTDDPLLAKQVLYQLSYAPFTLNRPAGFGYWWVWEDLNLRPHAYQACALTS